MSAAVARRTDRHQPGAAAPHGRSAIPKATATGHGSRRVVRSGGRVLLQLASSVGIRLDGRLWRSVGMSAHLLHPTGALLRRQGWHLARGGREWGVGVWGAAGRAEGLKGLGAVGRRGRGSQSGRRQKRYWVTLGTRATRTKAGVSAHTRSACCDPAGWHAAVHLEPLPNRTCWITSKKSPP